MGIPFRCPQGDGRKGPEWVDRGQWADIGGRRAAAGPTPAGGKR